MLATLARLRLPGSSSTVVVVHLSLRVGPVKLVVLIAVEN